MAIGIRLNFPDNSLKDYDRVCEALKFPRDWPDGLLTHSSHESDGHLVVNDVWESRDGFDSFVKSRLQDAIGKALGDRTREPQIAETPLHTLYARETKA
jgi:hypothetical protein